MKQSDKDTGRDRLVQRYTELALEYSRIPRGTGWKPEYEAREQEIKAELERLRKEIGI